jgi:hypothetical protein
VKGLRICSCLIVATAVGSSLVSIALAGQAAPPTITLKRANHYAKTAGREIFSHVKPRRGTINGTEDESTFKLQKVLPCKQKAYHYAGEPREVVFRCHYKMAITIRTFDAQGKLAREEVQPGGGQFFVYVDTAHPVTKPVLREGERNYPLRGRYRVYVTATRY